MKVINVVAGVALALAGFAAHAGTVAFGSSGFHGGLNNVDVTQSGTNRSFSAGAFSVTLTNVGGVTGAFEAYCVDLADTVVQGNTYTNQYTLMSASSYFGQVPGGTAGTDIVNSLNRLISYVKGANVFQTAGDKDAQSTALQLAIWNIVYDTTETGATRLNNGAGSFFARTSSATFAQGVSTGPANAQFMGANSLLANAASFTGGQAYELLVLSSGRPFTVPSTFNVQDQLIFRAVPEPTSLALAGLALVGLGFVGRRRR